MDNPLALVIEDDPQLSQIFTLTLSDLFETETIIDGSQALVRLSEIVPKLVVLDINLPGVSGAKILSTIRSDTRFHATHIILATADSRQADELRDQADIVLLKPISTIQLRDFAERLR